MMIDDFFIFKHIHEMVIIKQFATKWYDYQDFNGNEKSEKLCFDFITLNVLHLPCAISKKEYDLLNAYFKTLLNKTLKKKDKL